MQHWGLVKVCCLVSEETCTHLWQNYSVSARLGLFATSHFSTVTTMSHCLGFPSLLLDQVEHRRLKQPFLSSQSLQPKLKETRNQDCFRDGVDDNESRRSPIPPNLPICWNLIKIKWKTRSLKEDVQLRDMVGWNKGCFHPQKLIVRT